MSVAAVSWVLHNAPVDLTSGQRLVLLVIAEAANADGTHSHRAVNTIARLAGLSPRAVKQALAVLRDRRLIAKTGSHGSQEVSVYSVLMAEGGEPEFTGEPDDTGELSDQEGCLPLHLPGEPQFTHSKDLDPTTDPNTLYGERTAAGWFDYWWAAYPRKVGKQAARKSFLKAAEKVDPRTMIQGLAVQIPILQDRIDQGEIQFVPHPTTWLNQGRWDDDLAALRTGRRLLGVDAILAAKVTNDNYFRTDPPGGPR